MGKRRGGEGDKDSLRERARRREEEDERERREREELEDRARAGGRTVPGESTGRNSLPKDADELLRRAVPLIEQIDNLYRQYTLGVEKLPPLEARKRLEALVQQMDRLPKSTVAESFRLKGVKDSFLVHRDKWDRLMRDFELGRIKPIAGAGKKR